MNEKPVITVGGPPGAGTSTIGRGVCTELGLEYVSTGRIFREIAESRGLVVEDLSKVAGKEVDEEVDRRSREAMEKGGVVMGSKLAGAIHKDLADVKIWLNAPLEARANRIFYDEKKRIAREPFKDLDECKKHIQERFEEDSRRYREYYGIDLKDLSIYDLAINNENIPAEGVIKIITEYIRYVREEKK